MLCVPAFWMLFHSVDKINPRLSCFCQLKCKNPALSFCKQVHFHDALSHLSPVEHWTGKSLRDSVQNSLE